MEPERFIHLLYVPTMACNMQCRYCYLGDHTVPEDTAYSPLQTLDHAVSKFAEEGIVPFNISLHGGEVTTLPKEDFHDLAAYISAYYEKNHDLLLHEGFRIGRPHIKTNLLDLDKHMDTIREFDVSVSGSLDLPFSLHQEYRVTKGGKPTLEKILENIALMESLPNRKKVSATIFREHYERIDELIRDIRFLSENSCLDMKDFNFMIGFDAEGSQLLHPLTDEEQVGFFRKIRDAFLGTDLEEGLRGAWFAEFGPGYCTNSDVCGEKFFLLERNGDVYSCVRGQKNPDFYYGNIYRNSGSEILANASEKMRKVISECGFDEECADCRYLYLCKTGCPFVKRAYASKKSYTCRLQQELYKFWGLIPSGFNDDDVYDYLRNVHPEYAAKYRPPILPNEFPSLQTVIRKDSGLRSIFEKGVFLLNIDGNEFELESQLMRSGRSFTYIHPESSVCLYVRVGLLDEVCDYPENNAVFIQLLTGDTVQYGDEGRVKQRHIATEMIYKRVLEETPSDKEGFLKFDISHFLKKFGPYLSNDKPNNIFFTTASLRDYHYAKQKNNAFYHIQTINLPFHNQEFYYLKMEGENDHTEDVQ